MVTIGLVGGVASGKSMVGEMLAEMGAVVLDADRAAHEVLNEKEVCRELVARWGECVLASEGVVNRQEVAKIVFGDDPEAANEREFLESVVHPLTRDRLEKKRARLIADEGHQVFVIDAPLLLEAGWNASCDHILYMDAPEELRLKRAQKRGWTAGEVKRREKVQMPLSVKRHRADLAIDNSSDIRALRLQLEVFWNEVVQPQLEPSPN